MTMWRPDPLLDASYRQPTNVAFVMGASKRGFDCTTERSNINGRYRTQVNRHMPERQWNLAEGYGDTPLESQINAYARVIPTAGDPVWACLVLEAQVRVFAESLERIRAREARDRRNAEKLEAALNMLDAALESLRV